MDFEGALFDNATSTPLPLTPTPTPPHLSDNGSVPMHIINPPQGQDRDKNEKNWI